jgi:hypothetical protein
VDNVSVRGWSFVIDERSADGDWQPWRDNWEGWVFEILR